VLFITSGRKRILWCSLLYDHSHKLQLYQLIRQTIIQQVSVDKNPTALLILVFFL